MVNYPNFSFVGSPTTAGTSALTTWKVVLVLVWDVDCSQPSDLVAIREVSFICGVGCRNVLSESVLPDAPELIFMWSVWCVLNFR